MQWQILPGKPGHVRANVVTPAQVKGRHGTRPAIAKFCIEEIKAMLLAKQHPKKCWYKIRLKYRPSKGEFHVTPGRRPVDAQ